MDAGGSPLRDATQAQRLPDASDVFAPIVPYPAHGHNRSARQVPDDSACTATPVVAFRDGLARAAGASRGSAAALLTSQPVYPRRTAEPPMTPRLAEGSGRDHRKDHSRKIALPGRDIRDGPHQLLGFATLGKIAVHARAIRRQRRLRRVSAAD